MNLTNKALLLIAGLAISACTSPSQFGDGENTVDLNGPGSTTVDPLGDVTSTAYFNSAVGDRVLFAVNQSTLSPEARQVLTAQASWLIDNRDYTIVIEGHADEQGTREYNIGLSAKRASAVQQFLVQNGVSGGRISTVPYGKERPIEICSQEACYSKNRRAVTVLQAGIS